MWQYRNTEELYHHGVLGMKWGRRRYQNPDGSRTPAGKKRQETNPTVKESGRTKRLKSAIKSTKEDYDSFDAYKDSGVKTKKGKIVLTKNDVRDIQKATMNQMKKQEVKLIKSQYRDQIKAGSSTVGKIFNKITGADKIQADIKYDLDKRSKINGKWSD